MDHSTQPRTKSKTGVPRNHPDYQSLYRGAHWNVDGKTIEQSDRLHQEVRRIERVLSKRLKGDYFILSYATLSFFGEPGIEHLHYLTSSLREQQDASKMPNESSHMNHMQLVFSYPQSSHMNHMQLVFDCTLLISFTPNSNSLTIPKPLTITVPPTINFSKYDSIWPSFHQIAYVRHE